MARLPLVPLARQLVKLRSYRYMSLQELSAALGKPAGSLLRALAGTDRAEVNSLHSQGVARLAGGVTVEAVADDGLIEAFSVDADSFALAIQWHPEWRVTENPFSTAIFKAFGDACRERAARRMAPTSKV